MERGRERETGRGRERERGREEKKTRKREGERKQEWEGEREREREEGIHGTLCSINHRSVKHCIFDRAWPIMTYTERTWMVVCEKGEPRKNKRLD